MEKGALGAQVALWGRTRASLPSALAWSPGRVDLHSTAFSLQITILTVSYGEHPVCQIALVGFLSYSSFNAHNKLNR
jgi:hypothetical protein